MESFKIKTRTVVLAVISILADPAGAAIYTVSNTGDSGPGSLREAIAHANTLTGDDTIEFSVTGIIALTSGQLEISGDLTINGPGAADLTVSGSNLSRVIEVSGGATAQINGLTLSDGFAEVGAGIVNYGTLTLENTTISGNTAESNNESQGGGVANFGSLTLNNSMVIENTANGDGLGGGIFNAAMMNLSGSSIKDNLANQLGGGIYNSNTGNITIYSSTVAENLGSSDAGAICNYGTANLYDSLIVDNFSFGTGAVSNGGTLTISESTIRNNDSDFGPAGGISNSGTLRLSNTTISDNDSGDIGGINNRASGMTYLENSTVSGNRGSANGGIWNSGMLNLSNSTITENVVDAFGGNGSGGVYNADSSAICNVSNTIIAGNTDEDAGLSPDVYGHVNSIGYNLVGIVGSSTGLGVIGDQLGTVADPLDPLLGPLRDNGGPTETHALLPNSPAIDAGSNALVEPGTITDQRGFLRIVNGTVDIGAVESGDEGSYVFVEDDDGLLSIEAEHYKNNVAAGGAGRWARRDPAAPNASNNQAIKAADGPATATPGVGSYTTYVVVLQPGIHDVWVRFRAFSLGTDSLYFQFDNGEIQYKDLDPEDGQWQWAKFDNPITVNTEDVYTLVVYRRERLTELDKFVFTKDPGFDPTFVNGGHGPAESAWLVPCDTTLDFDSDLDPDCSDPDDDNDGVHDWYEIENMLNPFDPTNALLDPDDDGLSNLDEFLRNDDLDPNDPDTDDDGIGDALDTEASFARNECTGGNLVNATLALDQVLEYELTCAARESINVTSMEGTQDSGHLKLIAPTVILHSGFKADRLKVTSADSCPGCSSYSQILLTADFVRLGELVVTVDGLTTTLGDSELRYQRRTSEAFDDPATPEYDGKNLTTRKYLACETNTWSVGGLAYLADLVAQGVHRDDRSLIEKGMVGLDWGIEIPVLTDAGIHELYRECDGTTVADFGGTHHTTQWLQGIGMAVYMLLASDYAEEFEPRIRAYISRMEEIARLLVRNDNWELWEQMWLYDSNGDIYTHKTYMMAAALGMTSRLTADYDEANVWAVAAELIAQRGIDSQMEDGVNPEKGGFDVSYQMFGVWLGELYLGTLDHGDPMREQLTSALDNAIVWMSGRIDPATGQVAIDGSTRTCVSAGDYDSAETVRALLLWGHSQPGREALIDLAILVDTGAKTLGNPCPS